MSTTYDRPAIENFVRAEFRSMGVEEARMTPHSTLDELGLDSLDIVELTQIARKKLGISIHSDDFAHAETFGEAVGVIHACGQR